MYVPYNAVSGKPYEGTTNISALLRKAMELGTNDPRWYTFLQAKESGYKVRKGSKGTQICYSSVMEVQADTDGKTQKKYFVKRYVVFNATQLEGVKKYEVNS